MTHDDIHDVLADLARVRALYNVRGDEILRLERENKELRARDEARDGFLKDLREALDAFDAGDES